MARESVLIIEGRRYRLRLTLGALAEIEEGLEVDGLKALGARLSRLSASELLRVLGALMRAGGASDADPATLEIDPREAARAVAECFAASAP